MKHTKQALFHSIVALILCCSMLVGTTFAWFTDEVTSGVNKIQAGNLDIELEYLDGGDWKPVKSDKSVFPEGILWEPGHTEVVYLRIVNKGNLALKYQLSIGVEGETLSVTESGEVIQLSKYIHFGAVDGVSVPFADRDAARAAVTESKALTAGYTKTGTMTATNETAYMALVVYMPESVGNEANHATGADAPSIDLGIRLLATQLNSEMDSFGSDYDKDSLYPGGVIDFAVMAPVAADASGAVAAETTVGEEGKIHAKVPAGAQLIDPDAGLGLEIVTKNGTDSNIQAKAGQTMKPMDIKMPNLSPDNQELIKVTIPGLLKKGLNFGNAKMYHVENENTIEMTQVQTVGELNDHNQFYYDSATGDVTICTKSFSEYVTVTRDDNPWAGGAKTDWYNSTAKEFTITTEDQLAGLGVLVDNGNNFAGKTIKLGADLDLGGEVSFNPIGCGYVNGTKNSNGIEGKAFEGTFDGQNHVIRNLYQNGWDLGLSYCTLGGGLFASVHNATICNLTMVNADIVMECVEQGVVAGLAQGNCTFDNINIYNCSVANYQRATGGVVGEVSWGSGDAEIFTHTFSNIKIDSQTVIGSLWGDFDAPVGGVIGGYWDDSCRTRVDMNNVIVAARLDVYNDVTSTYQWYAYRRAGMLIGNTERVAADGRTADAPFLTCKNVVVKYGDWVNYHYCEFNNHNSSWPFVRVEKGENCEAFSNPRWGVPNDINGKKVVDMNHVHQEGGDCNVLLKFNQLYGGGQGVYGQTTHEGVTVHNYYYKVEYINDSKVHVTVSVTDENLNGDGTFTVANDAAAAAAVQNQMGTGYVVNYWMNAGSTKVDTIPAGNVEDVKLYPSFVDRYTATIVDQAGNVLDWTIFTADKTGYKTVSDKVGSITPPDLGEDLQFNGQWQVRYVKNNTTTKKMLADFNSNLSGIDVDITLYPIYTYDGDVNLIPIDNNGDGETDEYQVGGYSNPDGQEMVDIPDYVNGIKITSISANAFSGYKGVHAVLIPTTVETVGGNMLAVDWSILNRDGETVTIYYEGSYTDWLAKEETFTSGWDDGISDNSRIFFLNGTKKVDPNQGYMQAKLSGYVIGNSRKADWTHNNTIPTSFISEYTGSCDCNKNETNCTGTRPDAIYWEGVTIN